MSSSTVTLRARGTTRTFTRGVNVLGLAFLSLTGVGCDKVKFHISNSGSFEITVRADGDFVATVAPNSSTDAEPTVRNAASINVTVVKTSDNSPLGGQTVAVNPATEEVDVSVVGGQVFISVNPQFAEGEETESADPIEAVTASAVKGVQRAARSILRP